MQGSDNGACERMQIYVAAIKIRSIGALLFRQIVFAIPVDIGLFRMENLSSPAVVDGHIDFLHISIGLIGLEQVVDPVAIGRKHIRQTVIHTIIHIETNRGSHVGHVKI